MKNFWNLIISASLVFPTVVSFNSNKDKIVEVADNNLAFNIEQFNTFQDLALMDTNYMGTIEVIDLTSLTGISSIEIFKKFYVRVELPDFYAGVQLFNHTAQTHKLSMATGSWQEDASSDVIKLVEGREDIGSSSIYGKLTTKIDIQKNKKLNHLLFRMHFYGNGNFQSTGSHPKGEIVSGWVMKLILREL